jgi:hypothetical protein
MHAITILSLVAACSASVLPRQEPELGTALTCVPSNCTDLSKYASIICVEDQQVCAYVEGTVRWRIPTGTKCGDVNEYIKASC